MKLENIKIYEDLSDEDVVKYACKKNKIKFEKIVGYRVIKKSVDARDKSNVHYNYTIEVETQNECNNKENNNQINDETEKIIDSNKEVIIVGAGPAGLFCALTLLKNGIKPTIIEQGKKVEDREKDIDMFLKGGKLNPLSNVQFGEGGAGTFSDGKLTTGLHNPMCRTVLETFAKFGAPKEIEYINKPHIGTDNLVKIIKNIREFIIENGGNFLFEEKVVDFEIENGQISNVITKNKTGDTNKLHADSVVLAIGHSARDTFEKLYERNIKMEKKNFSVGVRIEHKQSMINKSQYGDKTKLKLPPAEYKLVYHGQVRDCYTFCMCPGGVVMASSSEEGTVVTNGMSKYARDGENANSAVLVNVTPLDFPGDSPLEGMYFQKKLEQKAFDLGGENYFAPIQRVEDFMNNRKSTFIGEVKPTYKPGVKLSNLQEILPDYVIQTLKEAIPYFDRKINGFANNDAILVGVETRSSSPVTIVRDENLMSNIEGVYPCGEGAGYAGGITSAAIDGIKCAQAIIKNILTI